MQFFLFVFLVAVWNTTLGFKSVSKGSGSLQRLQKSVCAAGLIASTLLGPISLPRLPDGLGISVVYAADSGLMYKSGKTPEKLNPEDKEIPVDFGYKDMTRLKSQFTTLALALDNFPIDFTYDDVTRLKKGLKEVNFLLDNWEKKTTYCNFGEVTNEFMAADKKADLIKEAAAGGLLDYDKSATMNVRCKRDPQVVRAFVGLSEDVNPTLYKAEKLMKDPKTLDLLQDDVDIDAYFNDVESYAEALAEVDSVSYAARTDYASTETRSKEDAKADAIAQEKGLAKKDFLAQSKGAVRKLSTALNGVVTKLNL